MESPPMEADSGDQMTLKGKQLWGRGKRNSAWLIMLGILALYLLTASLSFSVFSRQQLVATTAPVPPSPMPFTAGKRAIALAAALGVPQIEAAVLGSTFPPMSVNDVDIDEMHLQNFSIRSLKVALAAPSPDNITVKVSDVKLTIPDTGFLFKYGILTCPGVFRLKLGATQLAFNVHLSLINETLGIVVGSETTSINWGSLTFEHDLDSVLCRIGQSIVQVFIGEMDEMVEKNIKKELPTMLPKILGQEVNKALNESGIRFSAPIVMNHDRVSGQVELIPRHVPFGHPLAASSTVRRRRVVEDELPYKDFAVVLPRPSVNNFLAFLRQANFLNTSILLPPTITAEALKDVFPEAYSLCTDCAVSIGLAAREPPVVTFEGEGAVVQLRLSKMVTGVFFVPQNKSGHAEIARRFERSRLFHGADDAFPVFGDSMLCAWAADLFSTGCFPDGLEASGAIPVLAFSVDAKAAVGDLAVVGEKDNALQYNIHSIEDLTFSLISSMFGPVDMEKFAHDVAGLLNQFLIPLTNVDSPIEVPNPIRDLVVSVRNHAITAGLNISIF